MRMQVARRTVVDVVFFFFFNDTATTEIYTLSLHDALPIYWFPHPSPDGKWLVFLSYEKEVKGHPENKDVTLRVMPLGGGKIEVLAKLFGGQGTLNVPSWSPDSRKLAFVSYQFVP